ncbi:MAG: hypothetical protein AB7G06_01325 [Bdellovibrionales bacterium]
MSNVVRYIPRNSLWICNLDVDTVLRKNEQIFDAAGDALHDHGIHKVGDLVQASRAELVEILGKRTAKRLRRYFKSNAVPLECVVPFWQSQRRAPRLRPQ